MTDKKDCQFQPGQSGNPAGKPRGAKDKRTIWRKRLQDDAPKMIEKALELAHKGDKDMLKFLLDRVIPKRPRTETYVPIALSGSIQEKANQITDALKSEELTIEQTKDLMDILKSQFEITEKNKQDEPVTQVTFKLAGVEASDLTKESQESISTATATAT